LRDAASGAARRKNDLASLLRPEKRIGYPPEYLLSRIRGRRSRLIRDWRSLAAEASPAEHLASAQYQGFVRERTLEGIWRALLQEHAWVRGQMDESVRRDFAPYFLYAELRTVFIALRALTGEDKLKAAEMLKHSLLADDVRDALRSGDAAGAVADLEAVLAAVSPLLGGIAARFEAEGLRGVEQRLTAAFLHQVMAMPLPPVLRRFFGRIIDARNVLAVFKSLRFGERDPAAFLGEGSIGRERLLEVAERDDPYAVLPLVRQAAGVTLPEPDPTAVETALYRGITRGLRRDGRDQGAGLLLDYLWRCSLEVTNLSLLIAGKDLERDEIAAELVY
jgi:vacuolar-type H+-ATPase subunit C/Vma6